MGWNGWSGDGTDFSIIDTSGGAMDAGTMGDVPQTDSGSIIPDWGGIGSMIPNINFPSSAGGGAMVTQTGAMGGAAMALGAGAVALGARIAPAVFNAIVKLSARLGGASGSVLGYGRRVWGQLSAWAAKNPGVSMISMLVSLGLTVEEAAHFISWGVTSKRRKRGRGISARDVKTTRRTMRKLRSLNHLIATACTTAHFGRRRRK